MGHTPAGICHCLYCRTSSGADRGSRVVTIEESLRPSLTTALYLDSAYILHFQGFLTYHIWDAFKLLQGRHSVDIRESIEELPLESLVHLGRIQYVEHRDSHCLSRCICAGHHQEYRVIPQPTRCIFAWGDFWIRKDGRIDCVGHTGAEMLRALIYCLVVLYGFVDSELDILHMT